MKSFCAAMGAISLMGASVATAAPQASGPSTSAPTLVRIDGQLKTPPGNARTGSVTLVVSLYGEQEDATPLWVESQVVTLDAAGRYTIFAGATLADGVPTEFLSGATAGRWLGVAAQGEAEQFRMMLVTVPYAAKAREADTLAGKSVGDFVLTSNLTDTVKAALKASGVGLAGGSSTNGTGPSVSGTLNVIQKGAGGAAIADATGFVEVGGNVGIGTASPGALLDVTQPTTGATAVFVRNPTAGPGNYARLDIKTDTAGGRGLFDAYSSTFTTSANSVQSGVSFTAIGAGGFSIALQDPNAPMRFYTGAGPSERMRIDNSGNVGIGTTSPGFLLDVANRIRLRQFGTSVFDSAGMWLYQTTPATDRAFVGMKTDTQVGFYGNTGAGWGLVMDTTSGNVGIGTTDPSAGKLSVDGGSGIAVLGTTSSHTGVAGISDTSGYGVYGYSRDGSGVYGSSTSGYAGFFDGHVTVTDNICAANVSCVSDARLKQNVRSLDYGLPHLMRLRPVSWSWIDQTQRQLPIGLIAQEVDGVIPELVLRNTDPTKPLGLNYLGFVPVMIKAIQEQQDIITTLNAENTTLRQHNAALDARLTALEQTLRQLLGPPQGQAQPSRASSSDR